MSSSHASKALGFWTLLSLVMGTVIGSGIFLLPSTLAPYGIWGTAAWLASAVGALLLGIVFASLGHLEPKRGGGYAYCREAFGDFVGFLTAYSYWICLLAGNIAVIIVLVGYASYFYPAIARNHYLALGLSLGVLWAAILCNLMGIKKAGLLQLMMTLLKVIPLILLCLGGMFFIKWHHFAAYIYPLPPFHMGHFRHAVVLTFWSFLGLEAATVPGKDIDRPVVNIPRATLVGIILCAFIYILCDVMILGILPPSVLTQMNAPFAEAIKIIFGSWSGGLAAAFAIISILGALLGWLLVQGQILQAAAHDGVFPSVFGVTSKKGVPYWTFLINGTIASLFLILMHFNAHIASSYDWIVSIGVLSIMVPYLYVSMAHILIVLKHKEHFSRQKMALLILISLLAFAYIIWIIAGSDQKLVVGGTILIFLGTPLYVWLKRKSLIANKSVGGYNS